MSDVAEISVTWTDMEDMPRALRSAAVSTPKGYTVSLHGFTTKDLLIMARRLEDAAPLIVVREVPKARGGVEAVLYSAFLAVVVHVWMFGLIPIFAKAILRSLQ